jgi:hypothetical protein
VKKILFISLALIMALGVGLAGCAGDGDGNGVVTPTSIKVGLAREVNEDLAVFECGYGGTVYRWFADKVNNAGGIYLSDYNVTVPIELKVRDFDLATWNLGDVTKTLINTDKCDFIWGGPGTDCIFTQAPICNLAGKLLMTLEGGASSMIWDNQIQNWPFVWVSLSFANWYQIPVLHDVLATALGRNNVTAYITKIGQLGSTHGIEYATETNNVFGAGNVTDAGFHSYNLFTNPGEADAIILAAETAYNATPYDVFCAYTYPWNVAALTIALMASNFNPPAILMGPGGNANDYGFSFGPYAQGVMSFIVADNYTSTAISGLYAELAAAAQADWGNSTLPCANTKNYTSGWDTLDYWGQPCYVAALELWEDAVVQAGNLNSQDVRNALTTLNTTTVLGANTWFTVFGGGLGGGILAYECHPGEIGQWQSGEYRTIGGAANTSSITYPMTGSWFWLLD